jgi:hypothetical protein
MTKYTSWVQLEEDRPEMKMLRNPFALLSSRVVMLMRNKRRLGTS